VGPFLVFISSYFSLTFLFFLFSLFSPATCDLRPSNFLYVSNFPLFPREFGLNLFNLCPALSLPFDQFCSPFSLPRVISTSVCTPLVKRNPDRGHPKNFTLTVSPSLCSFRWIRGFSVSLIFPPRPLTVSFGPSSFPIRLCFNYSPPKHPRLFPFPTCLFPPPAI